jgi:signal transduction histidine kinase
MIKSCFSSRNFSKIDVAKFLKTENGTKGNGLFTLGEISYAVQLIDFPMKDGSIGNIVLLVPYNRTEQNLANFLTLLGVTFLISFILTNIFVSYHFAHTIATPLHHLQNAATEIARGNLDFQIAEEGDQEIQELCRDLEQMRIKLKESIHTQLRYEDNRKILVSSISHDLKTPVTTIKGYVEGILDGIASTPDKTEKYLKTIYLKAQQIDQMIDDLLLYAKLDLNQIPFHFEKTDIEQYLLDCITEIEPELERNHIHITFANLLNHKQSTNLDRDRMRRAMMNILDNCRKTWISHGGKSELF